MITNHSFYIKLTVESAEPLDRDQEEAVLALITRGVAGEKDNLPAGIRLVKERHTVIGSGGRTGEISFSGGGG